MFGQDLAIRALMFFGVYPAGVLSPKGLSQTFFNQRQPSPAPSPNASFG